MATIKAFDPFVQTKLKNREALIRDFDSVEEMLKLQLSPVNAGTEVAFLFGDDVAKARGVDGDRRWRGDVSSIKEFGEMLHSGGWKAGSAKMTDSVGEISAPRVQSIRRRKVWKDDGDEIDIHRVYAGDLERAWESSERYLTSGQSRNARLWCQMGFTANYEPDQFFWRGAVACVMVDALENAGYRVEIMGYHASVGTFSSGAVDWYTRVPIKGFMEPLDIPRVAAVTAHAGFFRSVIFGAMGAAPLKVSAGLGSTNHQRPEFVEEGDILVSNIYDENGARAYLEEAMKKYGVES